MLKANAKRRKWREPRSASDIAEFFVVPAGECFDIDKPMNFGRNSGSIQSMRQLMP